MNNESKQSDGVGYPPGTRIGKYEITERLGMGGQAIVYKAHDPLLDRYVAMKQISSHLAENPDFLDRFRKEAQILAKLATSQPALVTIHELIQEERGLFIVMEFVSGSTLETMLNNNPGPVEPKAVLQILWRLAGGLHAVHSAGVIHRDIKPGNIIVGEGLKVKIADFGVAAMSGGQTSMALGTTKYMAPELYGGETVDSRADMYSLGFIAYEMLLGRAKFNEVFADVVRDKSTEALRWMKWHGNEQVKAPALNEVNSAIPKPLADIVATMMVKNPEHRFASMEQLGRAIKASFSPRSGAQRDAGGAPPRSPNGVVAPGQGEMPSLESGEDLEVSVGPDTAPLPKVKMPLKTKLILAGAGMLVLVGAIVTWSILTNMHRNKEQEKAEAALTDADRDYKNGRYDEAEIPFSDIIKVYATDPAAKRPMEETLKAYKENLKIYTDKLSDKNASPEAIQAYRNKLDEATIAFSAIVKLHSRPDGAKLVMEEDADKSYKDAIDKDAQGAWADAESLFKTAAIQYGVVARLRPAEDPGVRSSVREHQARAHQAVESASLAMTGAERKPFWDVASSEGDNPQSKSSAKMVLVEAQRHPPCPLGPWVVPIEKEIADFAESQNHCRLFWKAIDEATILFKGGKFDDAQKVLTDGLSSARVTQAQGVVLNRLRVQIDTANFEAQFAAIMVSALDAVKQGNFPVAIEDLSKASKLLKDPLADLISSEDRAKHEKAITDLREKCRVGGNYDKEISLAKEAVENGDKAEQLGHLQNAYRIRPAKELDGQIKSLQSGMALEEGKALAKDNHFTEARAKLEESLKFKDNREAKDLLNKITLSEKYLALLKDADAAYNRQDYKKAGELYQQALDIDPSADEVKAKLNACLYEVKFAQAQALIKDKKYDEGIKLLEECRKLRPDKDADINQIEDEFKTARDYDRAIEEANNSLTAKHWSKAREQYEAARKIKDTQEAKDLIKKAFYGENLEKGVDAFSQNQWQAALAYFKIAQGYYDCKEIQDKIAEAQAKIK